ncbi:MAG: hypothetical protein LBD46_06540 [Endomicrobium sp.]|jgi:hypothetical protein|nr:hypothetical protein [Endomicrobium sp.]
MILKIKQGLLVRDFGVLNQVEGEQEKVLTITNLTSGNITIRASDGGGYWEVCKFEDGSDMVFTSESGSFIARLPVINYLIKAEGSEDVNPDVVITLS